MAQHPEERRMTLVKRGERVGSPRPDYVWWHELPEGEPADGLRSVGYEVVEVVPAPVVSRLAEALREIKDRPGWEMTNWPCREIASEALEAYSGDST